MKGDTFDLSSAAAKRFAVLAIVIALVVVTVPVVVSADNEVIGSPELSLSVRDNHFESSQAGQLTVQITNDGDIDRGGLGRYEERVQTARNVRFEIREDRIDAPIEVKSGPAVVGNLPPGTAQAGFGIEIGDAEPGRYRIPVEVSYEFTRIAEYDRDGSNPDYDDISRTRTRYVEIVVEDKPQFEIVSESTQNLFAGDTGRVRATIKNTGTETATDATVHLTSGTKGLFFGNFDAPEGSTAVFIDSLAPNETHQFSTTVGATEDLTRGSYPVDASVDYDNANGVAQQDRSLSVGVSVGPERTFALRNVTTAGLRVGQPSATVTGEIVNTGPAPVSDAVVRLKTTGPVSATGPEAAVGTLQPGESQPVSFTLGVSPKAEPGSRSLEFVTEYENAAGDTRTSDPIRQQVDIGREMTFTVRNLTADGLRVGENDVTVTGRLVNTGSGTARNAVVALQSSGAVQVTGPESAVGNLEPGESRPVTFTLAVPANAEPGSQSVRFDVEYENADGDVTHNVSPIRRSLDVGPEQDTFEVVDVETNLTAGDSGRVAVTLRYAGDEPISDVNARAFVNDPLSSSDNDAFLGRLEPGETKTAVFVMSATGDAIPKEYGAAVEVRYDEADGDSVLADGLSAGIPVAGGGGGLPLPFIALGGTLILVGGAVTVYRRQGE